MIFGSSLFWRETHKPAKFLIFEGRVVTVLLLAVMHFRVWTVCLALVTMAVFWWFDRKGIPVDAILRYVRSRIVGNRRSARGLHEERLAVDFAMEPALILKRETYRIAALNAPAKSGFLASMGLGRKVKHDG